MKLRIRGNSIRLRLTRREVSELVERGRVEDAADISPGRRLVYALECSDEAHGLEARLEQSTLTILVPRAEARGWALGDRVGLDAERPNGCGAMLRILVEKDFACLAPRAGEDDDDAFAHPDGKRC